MVSKKFIVYNVRTLKDVAEFDTLEDAKQYIYLQKKPYLYEIRQTYPTLKIN